MSSYDSWLERPYQDMMEESDRFYDWCEENGYPCETDEELAEAERAYLEYQDDLYEEWAVAQYEARAERLEELYYEREPW